MPYHKVLLALAAILLASCAGKSGETEIATLSAETVLKEKTPVERLAIAHDAWSQAMVFDMAGQPQLALEAVQAAVFYDPNDRWLQINLARRLRDFRRSPEAFLILRRALKMEGTESVDEWELAAGLMTENGMRDSAKIAWNKVLSLDPHSREALLGLAALNESAGVFGEAATWYARLSEESGARSGPLVDRAVALWTRVDRLDTATIFLRSRWDRWRLPSDGEALARILIGAGKPDSAAYILDTVAELAPEDSHRIGLVAARALLSAGQRSQALARLHQLDTEDPSDSKVRSSMGAILLDMDSLDQARRVFELERRSDSTNALTWYFLGIWAIHSNQIDSARYFLDRSLALDSQAIDTWIRRGMLELRPAPPQAVEVFRRMVAAWPQLPQARFLLGFSYARLALSLTRHPLREWSPPDSEPEASAARRQALLYFDSAQAIDTGMRRVHFERGSVLERLGDWKGAKRELALALVENPTDPMVSNYLGYLLADHGESLEQSEKLIQIAISGDPDNPAYLDSRAWLRYRQGRIPEALLDVDSAISRGEDDMTIKVHKARILEALHRNSEARELWIIVSKLDPGNPEARQGLERTK